MVQHAGLEISFGHWPAGQPLRHETGTAASRVALDQHLAEAAGLIYAGLKPRPAKLAGERLDKGIVIFDPNGRQVVAGFR